MESNSHLKWISIFIPSLYAHYCSICLIGFCQDLQANYTATLESVLFVCTVCSLISESRLWPKSLQLPPRTILYLYMSFSSIFLTNIAIRLIWLPLIDTQATFHMQLTNWLINLSLSCGLASSSPVIKLAEWLSENQGLTFGSRLVSAILFILVLEATGKLKSARDNLERIYSTFREVISTKQSTKERFKSRRGRHRKCYADSAYETPLQNQGGPHEDTTMQSMIAPDIQWDEDTD